MAGSTKKCPIQGCAGEISAERMMCQKHWFMTPTGIRPAIWMAFWEDDRETHARLAGEAVKTVNDLVAAKGKAG